jgi:hypothetical protein
MNRGSTMTHRCMIARCAAAALVWLVGTAAWAAGPVPWLPPDARPFAVGSQLEINGAPVQVQGFVSPHPPAQVVRALREAWPKPYTEDRVGPRSVFGRLVGDHYVTVQLEAAGSGGTRGVWNAPPVREALRTDPSAQQREALRWLPVGSDLQQWQRSVDGDRATTTVVARNRVDAAANAEHLIDRLQADGLRLERRIRSTDAPVRGEVLMFAAGRAEAMAVVSRDGGADTVIVLTTTERAEVRR